MLDSCDIAIIGPGKVGTAIGVLAARAGLRVVVGGRNSAKARDAASRIGPGAKARGVDDAAGSAKLVLLTVCDDAIEPLCAQLAQAKAFARGSVVAHCSGALGSDVLISARDQCGCHIGSMHPLQTFPTVEAAVAALPKAYCFCEGDAAAVDTLRELAQRIGSEAVVMDSGGKALYHAAAVMACNYLTTLLDCGLELMAAAGIDRQLAATALLPLVQATLDNNATLGPAAALTGPIARGDAATVARHVAALSGQTAALYRAAGLKTIELALKKGSIDAAKADALRKVLNAEHQE